MLDSWLIEVEDAYRRPLSIKKEKIKEKVKEEVKEVVKEEVKEVVKEEVKEKVKEVVEKKAFTIDKSLIDMENWEEHYVRKGDPSKPTYYIIRRFSATVGLFAIFILVAGHIRYALSKNWIPVVDMQNYSNFYLAPEKLGKENSWEYYFEQPLRIGLKEAYSGENIVLSTGQFVPFPQFNGVAIYESKEYQAPWRMLVKKGFLRVKKDLQKEIIAIREKLFAPTDRVLGVKLRGTDYVVKKPKNHPIPPSMSLAKSTVAEKLKEWNCNKIFLATEDKTIVQEFKTTFGDLCVTIDREYIEYDPKATQNRVNRENDVYLQGKDYLIETYLLSMCNSFVAAKSNSVACLMFLTENFENTFVFNLGLYT